MARLVREGRTAILRRAQWSPDLLYARLLEATMRDNTEESISAYIQNEKREALIVGLQTQALYDSKAQKELSELLEDSPEEARKRTVAEWVQFTPHENSFCINETQRDFLVQHYCQLFEGIRLGHEVPKVTGPQLQGFEDVSSLEYTI
jgi:hypothetical protein